MPGARELPGKWLLPGGLVDAHAHLTMNFGKVIPQAEVSDDLIAANCIAQRRPSVLALRDTGRAWGGGPREIGNSFDFSSRSSTGVDRDRGRSARGLEHLAMLGLAGLAIVGAAPVRTSTLRL